MNTKKQLSPVVPALRAQDPALLYLGFLIIVLVVVFGVTLGDRFLSMRNLQSMAYQIPELGILAIAMMLTMISGGIDLSIIATANATSLVTAAIIVSLMPDRVGPWPYMLLAVAAGLAVALLIGAVNGLLIAYVGVSPILATLGTSTLVSGLNVLLTGGYVISGFPEAILYLGNGAILGIPVPFFVFLACVIIVGLILHRTPFGMTIYMIGTNPHATAFSGISVRRVLLQIYTLAGFLAGIAALLMMARFNSARAGYASSYLLVTVLASVLGGVNPNGGSGTMVGLVMALATLQIISSGLNVLGASSHLTMALWGAILILVTFSPHARAWLQRWMRARSSRRSPQADAE